MPSRLLITLLSLSFAAVAVAEEAPIRIGVIGPFSAKSSSDMGESLRGGARVLEAELNQMGGVMGRKIELVERDDQANPEIGVAMAKELIQKEKVVAVVGFANTGVALPSSKVFQDAKVPLIITGATGAVITRQAMPPAVPDSYVFRIAASDALQPVAMLNDVLDRRKINQIAVLHDDSPYGTFGRDSLLAEMKKRGIAPLETASFKVGDQDMSNQISKVKQSGAHVIMLYCLPLEAAAVANSMRRAHLDIPLIGSWTLSHRGFAQQAGGNAEGARMPVTFIENEASTRSSAFSLAYQRLLGVKNIPSAVTAAQTYDALRILTLAIMQANSVEPVKIKHALEDLKYDATSTVISRYRKPFSSTDHEAITQNMIFMGEIRQGRVTYAYKEDAKSGLIVRTK